MGRLDELLEELEASPDDEASLRVYRALETFLEVQRTAFARVIQVLRAEGHSGVVERFLEDPLLASILRGYRLVEPDLEEKVREAVDALGLGERVRLVGVQSGVARLEAEADKETWKALKDEVDRAVRAAAPELVGVAVARLEPHGEGAPAPPTRLPVFSAAPAPEPARAWLPLIHWWTLEQQPLQVVTLFDEEILVCGADGRAYAFEDRCPRGQESLAGARLERFDLACDAHALTFDVRTGRCRQKPDLALTARPTRVEEGIVRVEAPRKADVH